MLRVSKKSEESDKQKKKNPTQIKKATPKTTSTSTSAENSVESKPISVSLGDRFGIFAGIGYGT